MGRHAQSIEGSVLNRVKSRGRGSVFTPGDFLDLGSRSAIDKALSRSAKSGVLRKLARGVYDYPRVDRKLGVLSAPTMDIAQALRGNHSARLQVSGATAANLLGLSSQVPAREVFLTDGPSRSVKIGRRQIVLKHTTPRQMATAGRVSGTVIQALRWLGPSNVDGRVLSLLRRNLSPGDKKVLKNDLRHAPIWVAEVLRKVVGGGE